MRPFLLFSFLFIFLSSTHPLHATSFIPISDGTLVDQAPLIAVVEILSLDDSGRASRPVSDYTVRVRRPLKGLLPAGDFIVRVPGGIGRDGRRLHVQGAPSFEPGERALLFLSPRPDGTHGVLQLFLGAFHEVAGEGRRLAVRRLDGARVVTSPGTAAPGEPVRDFDRFADWIAARAQGIRSTVSYEVATGPARIDRAVGAFNFIHIPPSETPYRWFEFNQGGSVPWRAYHTGQPGITGGGFAEFQDAIAVWNNDPGSQINLVSAGTTTSTSGFTASDGINSILFDDPNNEIGGEFNCPGGGVLAVGGFWDDNPLSGTFSALTYYRIPEGDIITARGLGCYVSDSSPPSEAAQEVFAHELGHALGLSHTNLPQNLMRPSPYNDGRGAYLGTDDRQAVRFLYGPDLDFHTLGPCRLYDSRTGPALTDGNPRLIPANGTCGVPQNARALAINVTAVNPAGSGYLTLYPRHETPPSTATLSFQTGRTRSNNAVVTLSAVAKSFMIRAALPPSGAVHVTVDVTGYFE